MPQLRNRCSADPCRAPRLRRAGTSVGSRTLTLKQAVCIAVIFEFTGALVLGRTITDTISGGAWRCLLRESLAKLIKRHDMMRYHAGGANINIARACTQVLRTSPPSPGNRRCSRTA
jgi:hypothetical protein